MLRDEFAEWESVLCPCQTWGRTCDKLFVEAGVTGEQKYSPPEVSLPFVSRSVSVFNP